ncbi:MAG TPA: SRPBCC family protein [Chitinophaga sp.]
MKTLKIVMPSPRHIETIRIFVKAKPEVAWETVRHFDMATVLWVHLLFRLRTAAEALRSPEHGSARHESIGIDEIARNNKGFKVLSETPGQEVVIGAIGKFWHLNIPFMEIEPEAFPAYQEPGWGKVAWALSVHPYSGGSTVSIELRISATDQKSWDRLWHYYRLIGPFSYQIRCSMMKHLQHELGNPDLPDDRQKILPGDEIIPDAAFSDTDHINIEAPVEIVWHYLMQLGCDRAGWYSIDLLDHGGIPSTDHLVAGWEHRKPGDRLSATPKLDSFFEVYQVAPKKHFVIGGEGKRLGGPFKVTWAFVLEPVSPFATHLIVRTRMTASPKWAEWIMGNVIYPPVHGLMEAVQLKTIKRYAERTAG